MSTAVLALTTAAACSAKTDNAADSAKKADSMAAAAAPATPAPAPAMADNGMSDANILAMADFANRADSSGGHMASTKGTAADVKAFGKMMITDHHKMHEEAMGLAKKTGITPVPAYQSDSVMAMAAMDTMNTTPKGAGWDKWYINHAIAEHEHVLAWAQSAANTTQNADIKAGLQKHAPIIQAHLDKAKAIQAAMK